jgi:predicted transcriptional regulator
MLTSNGESASTKIVRVSSLNITIFSTYITSVTSTHKDGIKYYSSFHYRVTREYLA